MKFLIVDFLNLFIRGYVCNSNTNDNGEYVGGIQSTLTILQKLIREIGPDKVIIAHDGENGSKKRKEKLKKYKEGRSLPKLNQKEFKFSSPVEQKENFLFQLEEITKLLDNFPFIQLKFQNAEADDIISCCVQLLKEENKTIIVSNDRDFFQLVQKNVLLYRPAEQKKNPLYNSKRIVEEFGIHPQNFALARAIAGDKSDNLEGIFGVGLKTIAKNFPFFLDNKPYSLYDLLSTCKNKKEKFFKSIQENEQLIQKNYELMQLYSSGISEFEQVKAALLNSSPPPFKMMKFLVEARKHKIDDLNLSSLVWHSKRLSSENQIFNQRG